MLTKNKEKKGRLSRIYKELINLSDRIDNHHLFLLASGIAFNILIYLIPMFLVAIYIVNIFFDGAELAQSLEKLVVEFLPPNASSLALMHSIIVEIQQIMTHSSLAGWIGICTLLWVSSALISSIRTGLNAIFQIAEPKIFIIYRFKDILLTIIITILILLYSYAVPLLNFLVSFIETFTPEAIQQIVSNMIVTLSSLAVSFGLFLFIFMFIPTKKLPRYIVIWSTVLCMGLIELSRHVFGWYISGISSYGKFYGTYAVLVSMAVWIYYSALIILLSAEFVKFMHDRREEIRSIQSAEDEINIPAE